MKNVMKKAELIQRIKDLLAFHKDCYVECDLDEDILKVLEDEKKEKNED